MRGTKTKQGLFEFAKPPRERRHPSGKKMGRPPLPANRRRVAHATRPTLTHHEPVHVTLRVVPCLPSLRRSALMTMIRGSLVEARERFGMRVTDFVVMADHLHLVVELDPTAADAPEASNSREGA
jgi:hypothetical protein